VQTPISKAVEAFDRHGMAVHERDGTRLGGLDLRVSRESHGSVLDERTIGGLAVGKLDHPRGSATRAPDASTHKYFIERAELIKFLLL
jgi:hypothetical protein